MRLSLLLLLWFEVVSLGELFLSGVFDTPFQPQSEAQTRKKMEVRIGRIS